MAHKNTIWVLYTYSTRFRLVSLSATLGANFVFLIFILLPLLPFFHSFSWDFAPLFVFSSLTCFWISRLQLTLVPRQGVVDIDFTARRWLVKSSLANRWLVDLGLVGVQWELVCCRCNGLGVWHDLKRFRF